jgi:site-specific DNA recombinase
VNKKHQHKDQSILRQYEKYQVVRAVWPGLVDEVVFDEVQHELDKNRIRRARGSRSRDYILSGILKCPECGDVFCGASAHGNSRVHRYYIHKKKEAKSCCKIKRIRAGKTEEAVIPNLGKIIHQLGYFDIARTKVDEMLRNRLAALKPEELRVKEELLRVDREIEHTLKLKNNENSEFSLTDVILNHLQKLKNDRENLEKTMKQIQNHTEAAQKLNVDWENSASLINKFNMGWKGLRPFQQTRLLHRVFKEIVIGVDGFTVICWDKPRLLE